MAEFPIVDSSASPDQGVENAVTVEDMEILSERMGYVSENASLVARFARCANEVGGNVHMIPEHRYSPAIQGVEGSLVLLYDFVEYVDEATDYARLVEALPLTYGQVHEALAFIRRLMMLGFDLDEIEGREDLEDEDLVAALRRGLQQREGFRVLGDG